MKGRAMAWLVGVMLAGAVEAGETFITLGTGGQTGVYFATGQSICALLNQHSSAHGIRCNATASGGGIANVHGMRNGEFDFGIMQADHLYKAREGTGPFQGEVAMSDIRALFSLQREVFTVLARRDAGIQGLDDLQGKRINIGNPGSGQRDTLEEIMAAKGWDRSTFAVASELKAAEQASALGEDNIDAMIYFVGHPNAAIEEATATVDAVLVPLDGDAVERLLERPYYSRDEIPAGLYKGNDQPTPSIGSRAVLATSSNADPQVVYELVKAVFDNLDRLRELHPALARLQVREMIASGLTAPLHEGAERYYRERGWL
ncbi:MAG TPA: TAXI family TRAP transporter solute-binding subunit [Pseudomonas sp.]